MFVREFDMSDVLTRIKRAALAGNLVFSQKARLEMRTDGLTETDIIESLLNAVAIYKKIRSTSQYRKQAREYLYIIASTNLDGMPIYTKGKLMRETDRETFYLLISSKRSL